MHGVHGHTEATAVPRSTLVDELEKHSEHHSTEKLAADEPFKSVTINLN
jgi:hypothetical protein